MPQFQPVFIASQLFWLYVIFGVLLLLLSTIALPKIGSVLEDRQRKIDDNLNKAGTLKLEAEAAIALYERALGKARADAKKILKEAGDSAVRRAEEAQKTLAAQLTAQVKAGEDRIAAAKGQALDHVRDVAAQVAQSAANKLAGLNLDDGLVAAAVAGAIKGGQL